MDPFLRPLDADGNVVESTGWDGVPPAHPWEAAGLEEPHREPVYEAGTEVEIEVDTPVVDPADNTLDDGDDEAGTTAS